MHRMCPLFWRDGEFLDGEAPERGTIGVFDTMLAAHGNILDAEDHYDRLIHDASLITGLKKLTVWMDVIHVLMIDNDLLDFARIRTSLTPDMVLIETFPCPDPKTLPPLTCAIIEDWPRVAGDKLENCKRLNYTRSFAARDKAQSLGADEAILTNTDGNVACGATSNLFIEENGVLITPPLSDGVLAGITRKHLISKGAREESITLERLKSADSLWLTNSIFGKRKVLLY